MFEKYNVVLFALDVDVMDRELQQRVRKVLIASPKDTLAYILVAVCLIELLLHAVTYIRAWPYME